MKLGKDIKIEIEYRNILYANGKDGFIMNYKKIMIK
jgi:hypothetical protein